MTDILTDTIYAAWAIATQPTMLALGIGTLIGTAIAIIRVSR